MTTRAVAETLSAGARPVVVPSRWWWALLWTVAALALGVGGILGVLVDQWRHWERLY